MVTILSYNPKLNFIAVMDELTLTYLGIGLGIAGIITTIIVAANLQITKKGK